MTDNIKKIRLGNTAGVAVGTNVRVGRKAQINCIDSQVKRLMHINIGNINNRITLVIDRHAAKRLAAQITANLAGEEFTHD